MLKKLTKKYNTLEFLIKRLKLSKSIKKIIIATSNLKKDDKILGIKERNVLFLEVVNKMFWKDIYKLQKNLI